jgi:serine/threonine protein kinase
MIDFKKTISFIKQKDYEFVRPIGRGGLGRTVLLRDSEINEQFVCKKYEPFDENLKDHYYEHFKQEVKLMYRFFHPNIVRIFTYHLYPTKTTGYILMEYIEGDTIDAFLKKYPEKINDIFFQTISAFSYLESQKILHRDIRAENILIGANDQVKNHRLWFRKTNFHRW